MKDKNDLLSFPSVFICAPSVAKKYMRILLTTTSYQDTPGKHHDVLKASELDVVRARGPLQEAALAGTMTWTLLQAGGGTTVELIYAVGGFRAGGFRDIPTVVDGVLRGQLARLKAFVETDHPKGPLPPRE